jgi:flagellar biosynthetic protein FliP
MNRAARLLLAVAALLAPAAAAAQSATVTLGEGTLSGKAIQLVLMLTVLSLAPGILMTITSFTRIVVALSLLRSGLGAQGVPPNPVVISLALFLSLFVMAPTFQAAWTTGVQPYTAGRLNEAQAFERTAEPFRVFMLRQVRDDDLKLFDQLGRDAGTIPKAAAPTPRAQTGLATLVPAFMISELRRAFEIGFLLLLPFLVIDLAVAAVLMAMGMMMLPPPTISLPCKIIFFVLVDGWALVAGSLVRSFGPGG